MSSMPEGRASNSPGPNPLKITSGTLLESPYVLLGPTSMISKFEGSKGLKFLTLLVSPHMKQGRLVVAWLLLQKWMIFSMCYPYLARSVDGQMNSISSSTEGQVCKITNRIIQQVEERANKEASVSQPKGSTSIVDPDPNNLDYKLKVEKIMKDLRDYNVSTYVDCLADNVC